MPITPTPPAGIKRTYPHVEEIKDWQTQQTTRLLWDRVHDLEERLQAAQSSIDELADGHNQNEDSLVRAQKGLNEAGRAINNLNTTVAGAPGPTLPPTAPNGMSILQAVYTAGGPGGAPWDFTTPDTYPVQSNPLGQGAFIDTAVPALHASDPNWGHIAKTPGHHQSAAGHAVDAINYKNVDGVTAEIYDVITSGGTLVWNFDDRTAANLAVWQYP